MDCPQYLCCIHCTKTLSNNDCLQDHIQHKIVTSSSILNAFSKKLQIIRKELLDGVYLELIEAQFQRHTQFEQFIITLADQIQQFQQDIIQQTKQLIDQIKQINLQQDKNILQHYKTIYNQQFHQLNVNQLIELVDKQKYFTEKQLKDGLNDVSGVASCLYINTDCKLDIVLPSTYYRQIYEKFEIQEQKIQFANEKLKELKIDFNEKLNSWVHVVDSLFTLKPTHQLALELKCKTQNLKPALIVKAELHRVCKKELLIFAQMNSIRFYPIETLKLKKSIKMKQSILDFDVDPDKQMISFLNGNDLFLYSILRSKKIRQYQITIDTTKGTCVKFFENQVCVSSGVLLQFFPTNPTSKLNIFTHQLNFHSYWDKVKVMDYYTFNKFGSSEMFLLIGTMSGLVSLFNSNFKELYSKQLHQGPVNQFKYQQSSKYGKLLLSIGDDQRINIYSVDQTQLKCLQMITFEAPINDILLMQNCFYVITRGLNQLDIYQINENQECKKTYFDGQICLDIKDRLLNIGEKVIIIRNQLLCCRLL